MMLQEEEPNNDIAEVRWSFDSNQAVAGNNNDLAAQRPGEEEEHDDDTMELKDLEEGVITNLNMSMFNNSVNSSITLSSADFDDSFFGLIDDEEEDNHHHNNNDMMPTRPRRRRTSCSALQAARQQVDSLPKVPGRRGSGKVSLGTRRASERSLKSISEHSVALIENESLDEIIDSLGRRVRVDLVPTRPKRRQSDNSSTRKSSNSTSTASSPRRPRRHSDSTCQSVPEEEAGVVHVMKKSPTSSLRRRRHSDSTCQSIPEEEEGEEVVAQVINSKRGGACFEEGEQEKEISTTSTTTTATRWGEGGRRYPLQNKKKPVSSSSCLRQPTRQQSAYWNATAA